MLERENVGNSAVARKAGAGNGKALLICHIDSVFPEGTNYIKPFTIKGNLATGNGVLDMKACKLFYTIHSDRVEDAFIEKYERLNYLAPEYVSIYSNMIIVLVQQMSNKKTVIYKNFSGQDRIFQISFQHFCDHAHNKELQQNAAVLLQ